MSDQPDIDGVTAHWQWAFDAASRALDADRDLISPGLVAQETRTLAEQKREIAALLGQVAQMSGVSPAPWLHAGPVTPGMLGLPTGTRACLFDLDGVLSDSGALHAAAWAGALDAVLLETADDQRHPFVPFDSALDYYAYFDGRPRMEGIHLFLAGRGLRLPPLLIEQIAQRKGELLERGLRGRAVAPLGGAHRYLQAVGLGRMRRAVVSASTSTLRMLEVAGLAQLVEARVDAETIREQGLRPRPSPDLLLAACKALDVEPARAVSLTHSGAGVIAAHSIHMPVIAISAREAAADLRAYGADLVVPALAELLDPRLRPS